MMAKRLPSQARLLERLFYEPSTGDLIWRINPNGIRGWNAKFAGTIAGSIGPKGYRYIRVDRCTFRSSRLVWMMVHGSDPAELFIDHINGRRSDDRIANLRIATREENARNAKCRNKNSHLPKGVKKNKNCFGARITANKKVIWLGNYPTAEAAHAAYVRAAKLLHKDFARVA